MTEIDIWSAFPKVDLHRHLEGSTRIATLIEIARKHRLDLPIDDLADLYKLVQVTDEDRTAEAFLSKFADLRRFFISPEIIERIAYEAVADAALDNVRYLELRFNPVALAATGALTFETAIDSVISGVHRAEGDYNIIVRLLISFNRAEPAVAQEILKVALNKTDMGLTGVDLSGDEINAPAEPFIEIFTEARRAGLAITVHAAEWAGAGNVRFAIEKLGAVRIGHGIRVIEDLAVVALAREKGVLFEVCITSNVQTSAASGLSVHPAFALYSTHGLNVSLHTDDPSISSIVLSGEFELAQLQLGFTLVDIREMTLLAARHAFLEPDKREELVARLTKEIAICGG